MAELNVFDISKTPLDLDEDAQVNLIDTLIEETFHQKYKDPLEECLLHFNCDFNIDESIEQVIPF